MKKYVKELKELFSVHKLIAMLLASLALGYVIVGFDLIPDSVAVIGYFDDVAMVLIAFITGGLLSRKVLGDKKGKK